MPKLHGFGEALHEAGDGDLVHHLGELARARGAQQLPHAGEMRDQRFGLRIVLRVAAAHHGEHAVLGARLPARDRRIDKAQALRLRDAVKLARHEGRCGGVIDEDRARLHGVKAALGPGRHLAQVIVVADTGEHEVGVPRRLGRACGRAGP